MTERSGTRVHRKLQYFFFNQDSIHSCTYLSEEVSYTQHKFYLFLLFSLQILAREEGEEVYQKGVDSGQTAKMETRVRTTTHQHIASESSMFVWTVANHLA